MLELYIPLAIVLGLLTMGLVLGKWNERRHFRHIHYREQQLREMTVTQIKSFPGGGPGSSPPCLVVGEAVVASDYLKSFLAGLRNIFGGEVKSFQTLLARARSEATLRMLEQARGLGYNAVCNVRLQTADVGGATSTSRLPMASIIASGTAYFVTR